MGDTGAAHGWDRVRNDAVWGHIRRIFLGSLLVFLVNVGLGFGNVVTPGEIPHWQLLTHLHGATLGWLTLSAIGFAVWLFTGSREVSATYERRVGWLSWAAVIIGAGYVLSFGVAFSLMGNAYALMPVFGTGMMLVIWSTALLALTQLRKQPVVRTVHLLVAGGFLVASFGAVMGVLLGLEHAVGSLGLGENIPNTGSHAGPMDIYAITIGAALVEWLVDREDASSWTWPGVLQVALYTLGGLLAFVPIEAVSGIGSLMGFLAGSIVFVLRVGWRGMATNPLRRDESAWGFFAPFGIVIFVGGFLLLMAGVIPEDAEWAGPVLFHAYFVVFVTNGLFGMYSGRTRDGRTLHEYAEPAALWLTNLGYLAFAATELAYGGRHGALIMGVGVLLGVASFGYRLVGESPGSHTAGVR